MQPVKRPQAKHISFSWRRRIATQALLIVLGFSYPILATELLFDGGFESGTLAGWVPGMQGSAIVVTKERCFSHGDSRGLKIQGQYAALLRGSQQLSPNIAASLTSKPFRAGKGVLFIALSESQNQDNSNSNSNSNDTPYALNISLLDKNNVLLSQQALQSARVELNPNCPSSPRDQQFSSHFISTRQYLGQTIKIRFSQHPDIAHTGKFSLIDQVSLVQPDEEPAYKNIPLAIAGIEFDTKTDSLYLKAGFAGMDRDINTDPDWEFYWVIEGEDEPRPYKNACINDLSPGNYQANLYINTRYGSTNDTLKFFITPETYRAPSTLAREARVCQKKPGAPAMPPIKMKQPVSDSKTHE